MILTHKYRLNPTRRQHRALESILEQQRQLYNAALEERIDAYQKTKQHHDEIRTHGEICFVFKKRILALVRRARKEKCPIIKKELEDTTIQLFLRYHHFRTEQRTRINARAAQAISISEAGQSRSLTQIRGQDTAFANIQRRIQRETLKRLDRAYKAFFRRVKQGLESPGFPKFKGREFFDGFGFDAFQQITFDGKRLRFAGMAGGLRVNLDRPLPGEIKNIWFKREGRNWYCGFQVERQEQPQRSKGKEIGVDWGTSNLAVFSTGEEIANPRPLESVAGNIAKIQRKVSRCKKGSRRRQKIRAQLQKLHRKVANRRRNHLDKVSKRLATQFRLIATEEFSVKAMMASGKKSDPKALSRRRNREALDAAPYLLRQMIGYKTTLYGSQHGLGGSKDGRNSTDVCSECWRSVTNELSNYWHHCFHCGTVLPRKVNAARVILARATGRGGPVPEGAKPGIGPVCPGNTEGCGDTSASGWRPKGLSPCVGQNAVASG